MASENVGIKAIQLYFPKNYVSQSDLEEYHEVGEGKYTRGLGQTEMGFCYDNEDINSIAMTVTKNLLESYNIDSKSIGYLAVGTETIVDKSKSVKTHLMSLFEGNTDIEGVDVKNACFGGTQAFFGAVDWVKANSKYDGRMAIAVMADIAVYSPGPARCTGGAGAIAILVGTNAPIVVEDGLRACYMNNSWDFYKPIGGMATEFPMVDGDLSLQSYLGAVDECYSTYRKKYQKLLEKEISVIDFYSVLFHCPFYKLVQKAFARLVFADFLNGKNDFELLDEFKEIEKTTSYTNKKFSTTSIMASEKLLQSKVGPNMTLNRRIGNMYTPSLYAQLVTLLSRSESIEKLNKQRVLLFSYGSGLASAMFSLRFNLEKENEISELNKMIKISQEAIERLDKRERHSPKHYDDIMNTRQNLVETKGSHIPTASLNGIAQHLFTGTYYLQSIDEMCRRNYDRVQ